MSQDEVTSIIEKIILAEAVLVPSLKGMYKKIDPLYTTLHKYERLLGLNPIGEEEPDPILKASRDVAHSFICDLLCTLNCGERNGLKTIYGYGGLTQEEKLISEVYEYFSTQEKEVIDEAIMYVNSDGLEKIKQLIRNREPGLNINDFLKDAIETGYRNTYELPPNLWIHGEIVANYVIQIASNKCPGLILKAIPIDLVVGLKGGEIDKEDLMLLEGVGARISRDSSFILVSIVNEIREGYQHLASRLWKYYLYPL